MARGSFRHNRSPRAPPRCARRGVGDRDLIENEPQRLRDDSAIRDDPAERSRLLAIHADAAAFFSGQVTGSWVPRYLESRALVDALGENSPWLLGFAPAEWTALTDHLRDLGYDDRTLQSSGLSVRARTGRLVDRFRDRLVLAIRNLNGDTVGFVGRTRSGAPDRGPKYLNSPTTPLYSKGHQLFGAFEARAALDRGAVLVLTEGPLDAIAVRAACGAEYAPVALCGSAVTAAQADLILQLTATPTIIVALDADDAGMAAASSCYYLLRSRRLRPELAQLSSGNDPAATLAEEGRKKLTTYIRMSTPLAFPLMDQIVARFQSRLQWIEGRVAAARAASRVIAAAEPAHRHALTNLLARQTGLTVETVRRGISHERSAAGRRATVR